MSRMEFTCDIPGCNASYSRKPHLNRHKARHRVQQLLPCPICGRAFERSDTLRRHVHQTHPENEATVIVPIQRACVSCRASKSRCEGNPGSPCTSCVRRGIYCSFSRSSKRGHGQPDVTGRSRAEKTQGFLQLYWESFHPHWPFVHRGSFDSRNEMPLLVQSMVVIGMWISGVPNTRSAAIELHKTLNASICQQKDKWDASTVVNVSSACEWPLPMYQAILLHIIFALLSKGIGSLTLDLDLKPTLKPADAEILASLVKSCRKLGMFEYKNILGRLQLDDLPSYVWVTVEEIKRFNLALFKLCRRLSSERQYTTAHAGGGDLGTAGTPIAMTQTSWLLTAHELEFPMPRNDSLWLAKGKEEWMAAVDNVEAIDFTNMMESKWISNSADILQLT